MTYIYDVLLNFTDDKRLVEFFEWDSNDTLEHIKRIPLIRVSTKQINEIIHNDIKATRSLLDKIKGLTLMYRKTKNLEYALLISDLNKVIALEFNKNGEVIAKSSLLLDEEEEIIDESYELNEEKITYDIQSKIKIDTFLTRTEIKKQNYLLKELDCLYKEKNKEKLTYLYEEIYIKDNLSFEDKYLKLKKDIEENYSLQHNDLYDIVRLTHIKK